MTIKLRRGSGLPFNLPDKPEGQVPQMPWDIGDLTDDQLMALMSEFTGWANYLAVETANAVLEEEALEDQIRVIQAGITRTPGKIVAARAELEGTEEMIQLRRKFRVARHRRHLIEGIFDNCNRSANTCSRELSRRIASAPSQRRTSWSTP